MGVMCVKLLRAGGVCVSDGQGQAVLRHSLVQSIGFIVVKNCTLLSMGPLFCRQSCKR